MSRGSHMKTRYAGKQNEFALNMIGMAEQYIRGTLLGLSARVIKGTPVDEGFLINNWQAQLNQIPSGMIANADKNGGASDNSAQSALSGMKAGDTFWLVNNLPYAIPIEYGHSTRKAPQGMLRIAIAETAAAIEAGR